MTTGLTYNTYVSQIATLAVVQSTEVNFVSILPQMITYAENRMCRDLDFLSTQIANTYTLTSGNNQLAIPTGDFITLQTINVVINGNSTPVLPVSKEYIQNVYGSNSASGIPVVFAVYGGDQATTGNTSQNLTFGPWPDSNYTISVTGTARPASLSPTNSTTNLMFAPRYFSL